MTHLYQISIHFARYFCLNKIMHYLSHNSATDVSMTSKWNSFLPHLINVETNIFLSHPIFRRHLIPRTCFLLSFSAHLSIGLFLELVIFLVFWFNSSCVTPSILDWKHFCFCKLILSLFKDKKPYIDNLTFKSSCHS